MPIQIIPKINIIPGTTPVEKPKTKPVNIAIPSGFADTCYFENSIAFLPEIIDDVDGICSKEDVVRINEMKQYFSSMDKEELQRLHQKSIQSYIDDTIARLRIIKRENGICTYKPSDLTKDTQMYLKENKLKLVAMQQAYFDDCPKGQRNSYRIWFDSDIGTPSSKPAKTVYEHPFDKILRHTGIFNDDDYKKINIITKHYEKYSLPQLMEEKFKILDKMQEYFIGKNSDLVGQYTNRELIAMKKLAQKYYSINKLQTSAGYFSMSLEAILYSNTYNFKPGEYVEGLGLITDELKIDGKNTIITFIDKISECSFRIFDKDVLNKKNEFLKNLSQNLSLEDLNRINQQAQDIIDQEEKGLISQVSFEIADKSKTKQYLKQSNDEDYADKIMQENKYSYIIRGFRNYYKKNNPTAGKVVGIKLLSFLKKINAKPIFLIARPYGDSTHSPVSMYLYTGFKPLSKTEKDVYNAMNEHFEYADKNSLAMYLSDFENMSKKVDILCKLYFTDMN